MARDNVTPSSLQSNMCTTAGKSLTLTCDDSHNKQPHAADRVCMSPSRTIWNCASAQRPASSRLLSLETPYGEPRCITFSAAQQNSLAKSLAFQVSHLEGKINSRRCSCAFWRPYTSQPSTFQVETGATVQQCMLLRRRRRCHPWALPITNCWAVLLQRRLQRRRLSPHNSSTRRSTKPPVITACWMTTCSRPELSTSCLGQRQQVWVFLVHLQDWFSPHPLLLSRPRLPCSGPPIHLHMAVRVNGRRGTCKHCCSSIKPTYRTTPKHAAGRCRSERPDVLSDPNYAVRV